MQESLGRGDLEIKRNDRLGREERSQSDAKKAFRRLKSEGRARVRVSKFQPPRDSNEISVNRMDLAPKSTMAAIGKRNASHLNKQFWGWYILTAEDVEEAGCSIKPSPLKDNRYHADIIIPVALDAEDRRDTIIEHARDLAYHATFLPWGKWTGSFVE